MQIGGGEAEKMGLEDDAKLLRMGQNWSNPMQLIREERDYQHGRN